MVAEMVREEGDKAGGWLDRGQLVSPGFLRRVEGDILNNLRTGSIGV